MKICVKENRCLMCAVSNTEFRSKLHCNLVQRLNKIVIVEPAHNASLIIVDLKGVVQLIVAPQNGNNSWPALSELSTIGCRQ